MRGRCSLCTGGSAAVCTALHVAGTLSERWRRGGSALAASLHSPGDLASTGPVNNYSPYQLMCTRLGTVDVKTGCLLWHVPPDWSVMRNIAKGFRLLFHDCVHSVLK